MLYADDSKLISRIKNDTNVANLQKDIDIINNWCETWLMKLIVSKCKVMHMGKNNQKAAYSMFETDLETSTCEKDLGIHITDDLKWSTHVQIIAARTNNNFRHVKALNNV